MFKKLRKRSGQAFIRIGNWMLKEDSSAPQQTTIQSGESFCTETKQFIFYEESSGQPRIINLGALITNDEHAAAMDAYRSDITNEVNQRLDDMRDIISGQLQSYVGRNTTMPVVNATTGLSESKIMERINELEYANRNMSRILDELLGRINMLEDRIYTLSLRIELPIPTQTNSAAGLAGYRNGNSEGLNGALWESYLVQQQSRRVFQDFVPSLEKAAEEPKQQPRADEPGDRNLTPSL